MVPTHLPHQLLRLLPLGATGKSRGHVTFATSLSLTKHASFQKDVRITLGVRIVVPQPPILKRLLISTGLRLLPYRMGPLMLLFLGLVVFAWAPSPFCLRHIRKHQSLLICAPAPRPQKGPPEATPFFAFAREQACHLMYLTEAFCLGS